MNEAGGCIENTRKEVRLELEVLVGSVGSVEVVRVVFYGMMVLGRGMIVYVLSS